MNLVSISLELWLGLVFMTANEWHFLFHHFIVYVYTYLYISNIHDVRSKALEKWFSVTIRHSLLHITKNRYSCVQTRVNYRLTFIFFLSFLYIIFYFIYTYIYFFTFSFFNFIFTLLLECGPWELWRLRKL